MRVSYLLRFDDLSPWTRRESLNPIEDALGRLDVRPLVAVIPDNRDPGLTRGDPDPSFWERVRRWQANGWTIGLHGYQHVFLTGNGGLLGLNPRSEFAGLAPAEQQRRIDLALEILAGHGVFPSVWVAPAHSFDRDTLRAVRERGIGIVSDGFWRSPRIDQEGMIWVPQQLWRFRRCPPGLWTVCIHFDRWSAGQVQAFLANVHRYRHRIVDLTTALRYHPARSVSPGDRRIAAAFRSALRLRRAAGRRLGPRLRSG